MLPNPKPQTPLANSESGAKGVISLMHRPNCPQRWRRHGTQSFPGIFPALGIAYPIEPRPCLQS